MKFDVYSSFYQNRSENLAPRLRLQVLWVIEGTPSSGHLSVMVRCNTLLSERKEVIYWQYNQHGSSSSKVIKWLLYILKKYDLIWFDNSKNNKSGTFDDGRRYKCYNDGSIEINIVAKKDLIDNGGTLCGR